MSTITSTKIGTKASGNIPTGFRGKTATLIPELNRYHVAVAAHESEPAAVWVFAPGGRTH